jgi:hypothetical protein
MYLPDGLLTATDKMIRHCPQGTFKETWQRVGIAGCVACGTGDWLSDRTIFISDMDPNTGLVRQQIGVRGSTDSCCECALCLAGWLAQCCAWLAGQQLLRLLHVAIYVRIQLPAATA